MKTILYTDMDALTYRAEPGLSKHELDAFAVAPLLYDRKQKHKKTSKAMEMGTIIHSLVLEDRVEYAALPSDIDRRTKAGKDAYQRFCEEHHGKFVISAEEEQMVLGVQAAAKPMLDELMQGCKRKVVEASMFWERKGTQCKGRPDLVVQQGDKYIIIDLKTTNGITGFDRNFFSLRYHWQAAWYMYGLSQVIDIPIDAVEFYFAVVDTEDPHLTQVIIPASELIAEAQESIDGELTKFLFCTTNNVWPGLPKRRIIYGRE
jgi:ATP-dependent exoDNAse (exonuclease V) beta subunit